MNSRLILCLGNELLSDDGLGLVVARRLQESPQPICADVYSTALAGFSLLDVITGRREILIVDAIVTGAASPGTIHEFPVIQLAPTWNLTSSHHVSLPTVIEMGRLYGMSMPEHIDVIAVEAADVLTLHEGLTPSVARAVSEVVAFARRWAGWPVLPRPTVGEFPADIRQLP